MTGIIIAAILIFLIVMFILCYNKLTKERITVDEAFSTMDVYLKKRFDLIPNLVETVKGYAKHEAETLSSIIGKRSHDYAGMTQEEKISTGASISQMMPKILALAEAYPDLKANANFQNLSMQLERMEEENVIILPYRRFHAILLLEFSILRQSQCMKLTARNNEKM